MSRKPKGKEPEAPPELDEIMRTILKAPPQHKPAKKVAAKADRPTKRKGAKPDAK